MYNRKNIAPIVASHFDMTDRGVRKMASENPLKYDDYLRACLCDMVGIKTEDLFTILNEGLKTENLAEYIRLGNILSKLQAPKYSPFDELVANSLNSKTHIEEIRSTFYNYSDGKFLVLNVAQSETDIGDVRKLTGQITFTVNDIRSQLFDLDKKTILFVDTVNYRLKSIDEIKAEIEPFLGAYSLKNIPYAKNDKGVIVFEPTKTDKQNNPVEFRFWDKNNADVVYQYKKGSIDIESIIDGQSISKISYRNALKLLEKYDAANLAFFKTLSRFIDDDDMDTPYEDINCELNPIDDVWGWINCTSAKFSTALWEVIATKAALEYMTQLQTAGMANSKQKKIAAVPDDEELKVLSNFFAESGLTNLRLNECYEVEVTISDNTSRLASFISAKRI